MSLPRCESPALLMVLKILLAYTLSRSVDLTYTKVPGVVMDSFIRVHLLPPPVQQSSGERFVNSVLSDIRVWVNVFLKDTSFEHKIGQMSDLLKIRRVKRCLCGDLLQFEHIYALFMLAVWSWISCWKIIRTFVQTWDNPGPPGTDGSLTVRQRSIWTQCDFASSA